MVAYATVADVKASMDFPNDDRDPYLAMLIESVSEDIDRQCHRSFAAAAAADVTVYLDVIRSSPSLVYANGAGVTTDGRTLDVVSITTLSVRDSETSSYAAITASDTGYYLDVIDPVGVAGTDWPWEDVVLSPAGSRTVWPLGKRAVKIVGKLGFPLVPSAVREATVGEVRERYRQGPGGGPSQQGVNQFGTPIFLTGDSPAMRRIIRTGSSFVRHSWAAM